MKKNIFAKSETEYPYSIVLQPSSEYNAYLKQIKVILSAVKKYCIFSLVMNTIYIFFTVANREAVSTI